MVGTHDIVSGTGTMPCSDILATCFFQLAPLQSADGDGATRQT
jgi:hypothetical protein